MESRSPHAKGQLLLERTCPSMSEDTTVSCAKWLNRSRCCLCYGLEWAREKKALGEVHTGAIWRIPLNVDAACCQITLSTCHCCCDFVFLLERRHGNACRGHSIKKFRAASLCRIVACRSNWRQSEMEGKDNTKLREIFDSLNKIVVMI